MKNKKYWIIGIMLAVFIITNPSQKAFKEYLGSTSYNGLRRTSNYFICSVYNDGDKYFAILGNFFNITPKPWHPPSGDTLVDTMQMTDSSKMQMYDTNKVSGFTKDGLPILKKH